MATSCRRRRHPGTARRWASGRRIAAGCSTRHPADSPVGLRDRALLAVLAYTGCRVGELTRLKIASYKEDGTHKILAILGKGGKERTVPLHPEARSDSPRGFKCWGRRDILRGRVFRPLKAARGNGKMGFADRPMTRRAVQLLMKGYVQRLGLDSHASVHSLRVTALTTARERGCDIIDLQDFAGHSDPRTTLSYIRTRDRLSRSPAYVLKY